MDNKQQVDLVYLDFAKAFDRVPHTELIYKLHLLGIRDPLLTWFRSYLYKRRHRVVIDGFASDGNIWCTSRFGPWTAPIFVVYQ